MSNSFTEEIPADCSGTIVGLSDPGIKEGRIQIYPNPVSGQFTISGASGTQIEILSSTGQLQLTIHPNENLHTVDVSALPAGLYFVKVMRPDGISVEIQKIVKQ